MGDATHKIYGRFGGNAHIVGNTIFRIGVVAADEIQLVVAAAAGPPLHQIVIQPIAPKPLQGHTQIGLRRTQCDADGQQNEVDHGEPGNGGRVFVLQAVEDSPIPEVHEVGRTYQNHDH